MSGAIRRYREEYSTLHHSASTRVTNSGTFDRFSEYLADALGWDPPVRAVGRQHIEGFQVYRVRSSDARATVSKRVGIISRASVNRDLRTLRAFFNWCVAVGLIPETPFQAIKIPREVRRFQVDKVTSADEARQLLRYLDREGDRYHADLIRVIANTGIRLGEALWLYSEDVDFKARKLLVRNREGHLLKDREDRAIPLNAVALRALKRRVSEVSQRQCCPLFPDFSGGNYNVQRMGHKIKKRARAAGVPNLTAYGLRHGFGTKMAEVLTPYQLAAVMGHAKIETTNKYYVHREKMQITIPPLVG